MGDQEGAPTMAAPGKAAVPAFFGCVDLKYGDDGGVRVLELGDGHTSGFTGAGAFIPRAFESSGYTRKVLSPAAVTVVENKVLTHDAFDEAGLLDLRPRAGSFPMVYSANLAADVLAAVGGGPCVLKLCDRQRGCGVVVVEDPGALDATLRKLLDLPPSDVEDAPAETSRTRIPEWVAVARRAAHLDGLEEQVTHWRSNECPCFLAEALCKSKLVKGPGGRSYDGTLRVGFALEFAEGKPGAVQCLGTYWKLPDAPADDAAAAVGARTVSHTHGGTGTAACAPDDEREVWAALQGVLVKLFHLESVSVPGLTERYERDSLLLIVVLCRIASGYVEHMPEIAQNTLFLAEGMLPDGGGAIVRRVRSYFWRSKGTLLARQRKGAPNWAAAAPCYEKALAVMPSNAGAAYLTGMAHFARRTYALAAAHFARSLAADCDFAPAYSQLATCCLLLESPRACVEISEAMLVRHNRVAAAYHHIAAALYAEEAAALAHDAERRGRASAALHRARELQRGKSWGREDDAMLAALDSSGTVPTVPVRTWLFHAWRL